MDKAHVEHAVSFVEDQDFHVGQVNGALVGQVEQAAWAGDEYVDTTGHGLHLRVHAYAAKDHGADEFEVAGIQLEAVMHLGGQFAGRGQDQDARLFRAVAMFAVGVTVREQTLENWQGETAGFTGAGLCRHHQITTLQGGRDGTLLHWGRLGVAGSLDGAD